MKLASYITKYLEEIGTEYIFGVPAGTTGPLWDNINDTSIKPIITKNEAGAVYSATNYSDVANKLGVVMLAGAVGINNAINGIADASRRKIPLLVISGFVHRKQIGKGAIQELNTEKIVEPITKYSKTILDEELVMSELMGAIEIANTPPCGPVHIAIPMDLQMHDWGNVGIVRINAKQSNEYDFKSIESAVQVINESTKGIIFAGRGCKLAGKGVMELSKKLK